jgi:hypothetical protein
MKPVTMTCPGYHCGKDVQILKRGTRIIWDTHQSAHPHSIRCWTSGMPLSKSMTAIAREKLHDDESKS